MGTPTAIDVYLLKRDDKLLSLVFSASIIKQSSQLHNLKLPTISLFFPNKFMLCFTDGNHDLIMLALAS
jgi:hypothetical protein